MESSDERVMDQVTDRLRDCFIEVFPDLADDQIESAVRVEMSEWDSLATLTLLAVVEEEFGLALDDEAIAKLTSFSAVREVIEADGH
jgi:acyl carrier protein